MFRRRRLSLDESSARSSFTVFLLIGSLIVLVLFSPVFWILIIQNTTQTDKGPTINWPNLGNTFFLILFTGLATSFLASLFFALLYSILLEKLQREVIIKEMKQSLEKTFYQHMPVETYAASNDKNVKFGQAILSELSRSLIYNIKTVTGFYVPSWLRSNAASANNLTLRILLLDPRKINNTLLPFIREYSAENKYQSEEEEIDKLKKDIYITIAKLYRLRSCASSILIKVYSDSVFYRSEIFETFAFVSYYEKVPPETRFPEAYKYAKDNIQYRAVLADFNQTWRINGDAAEFVTSTGDDTLKTFLRKIGCNEDLVEGWDTLLAGSDQEYH